MGKRLLGVTLVAGLAVLSGCVSGERKAADLKAAAPVVEPVEPPFNPSPDTWPKGELYRVWPYGNGEVAGWVGTKQGVEKGDYLILSRDGVRINTVEVLRAYPDTFFGRVMERGRLDVAPQVGDIALKGPQPPKVAPAPESDAGK